MLLEKYNLQENSSSVISDEPILGDRIDSRKAYFTRLNRVATGGKRRNLRSGSYRRGNIFSATGFAQRVIVKAHFKKHSSGGAGAGNLRGHLSYITRDGAGIEEERPELFGAFSELDSDLNRSDFYSLCKDDRHHFRFIISPENGHEIEDFEGYIKRIMGKMESDLDTKLEWVSAVHYDTDNTHAHVILRGKDDKGKDLVIAPDYISFGIRSVAQEVVTEILGERSLEDLQRSMGKEVRELRVTSLDRFIEQRGQKIEAEHGDIGEIRIRSRELGLDSRDNFYGDLVKRRLDFLTTTSMARLEAHDVYYVRSDFMEELKEISEKHDIIKQIYRSMPDEEHGISIYKIDENGKSPTIQGYIEKIAKTNELTDHKYMVIRDGLDELHYVPLALNKRTDALVEGMIVEVSSGVKSTGKADKNILEIASSNSGIYTREAHIEHVRKEMSFIEDFESYVDYHVVRLETLKKAGLVESDNNGGYWVADDVVENGAALNIEMEKKQKKRHYAKVKTISNMPLEKQINANARTFLDLEIYRYQKGYDLSYKEADSVTLDAIHKRMDWLEVRDYGYYRGEDGQFVMKGDSLKKLYDVEIEEFGNKVVKKLSADGLHKIKLLENEKYKVNYLGFVDLHSGHHIVVEKNRHISVVRSENKSGEWIASEPLDLIQGEKGMEVHRKILNKSKEDALVHFAEKFGVSYNQDLHIGKSLNVSYMGSVHLRDGVYAAVAHENELCFVKTKSYLVAERGQELELKSGKDNLVEIKKVSDQRELSLERELKLERMREIEYEESLELEQEKAKEIELGDDWWD